MNLNTAWDWDTVFKWSLWNAGVQSQKWCSRGLDGPPLCALQEASLQWLFPPCPRAVTEARGQSPERKGLKVYHSTCSMGTWVEPQKLSSQMPTWLDRSGRGRRHEDTLSLSLPKEKRRGRNILAPPTNQFPTSVSHWPNPARNQLTWEPGDCRQPKAVWVH